MQFTGYRIEDEDLDFLDAVSDPLSEMFDHFYSGSSSAPAEIDPRPWLEIEDQLQIGACCGNSLTNVLEMCYHIQTNGEIIQFSRRFAYLAAQTMGGEIGQDDGCTIAECRKAAFEMGCCIEDVFPYWSPPGVYSPEIPREAIDAAQQYKIRSSAICRNYNDVFRFISSGQGGVQFGVMIGDEWFRCDGLIEDWQPGDGGHAMSFVGYTSRRDDQGRNYLLIPQTWGKQWGNRGWAEIAPRVIDKMARHDHTVMIGMSDLTVDERQPRHVPWTGDGSVF